MFVFDKNRSIKFLTNDQYLIGIKGKAAVSMLQEELKKQVNNLIELLLDLDQRVTNAPTRNCLKI